MLMLFQKLKSFSILLDEFVFTIGGVTETYRRFWDVFVYLAAASSHYLWKYVTTGVEYRYYDSGTDTWELLNMNLPNP